MCSPSFSSTCQRPWRVADDLVGDSTRPDDLPRAGKRPWQRPWRVAHDLASAVECSRDSGEAVSGPRGTAPIVNSFFKFFKIILISIQVAESKNKTVTCENDFESAKKNEEIFKMLSIWTWKINEMGTC